MVRHETCERATLALPKVGTQIWPYTIVSGCAAAPIPAAALQG